MSSSERLLSGTTSAKRGVPSRTGGERGEFLPESFRNFLEFLPESPSRTGGMAQRAYSSSPDSRSPKATPDKPPCPIFRFFRFVWR